MWAVFLWQKTPSWSQLSPLQMTLDSASPSLTAFPGRAVVRCPSLGEVSSHLRHSLFKCETLSNVHPTIFVSTSAFSPFSGASRLPSHLVLPAHPISCLVCSIYRWNVSDPTPPPDLHSHLHYLSSPGASKLGHLASAYFHSRLSL